MHSSTQKQKRYIIFFESNYILACNNLNKVSFRIDKCKHHLLIDTGASVSAIRHDSIERLRIPYHKESVNIKGIGGEIFSEGYVFLDLEYNGYIFTHKFLIFKSLPCKTDGILGQDFLSKYHAILNFELSTLQLITQTDQIVTLKLDYLTQSSNNYVSIPARCEFVHYIETELQGDCIVHSQELCEGVYLANTLAKPNNRKMPIRILNTRDTSVTLKYFQVNTSKLQEYLVCQFNKQPINADRVKMLFSQLNLQHLNDEEQITIEQICAKYPDIFHLPGDTLTTTPIYEQNIDLKPHSSPIYTKPYRLPHAQKSEIDKQIKNMLDSGIIEESRSAWSSPLLLVPKKSIPTWKRNGV